jgi:serine/threonine-protein kinase HipA
LQGERVFYASAMTLLGRQDSEGASYVDLARLLLTLGNPATLKHDLEQLFRRVVFNVCVSNRDDHLRNHGFLFDGKNWRLSPAFDVNPNLAKAEHVLNLDALTNRSDLDLIASTASYYDLNESQAQKIIVEVKAVVRTWKAQARTLKLSSADIALMEPAFNLVN